MNNSEFDFGQSQGQKLAFAFRRAGEGNELLEWLSTGDNLKKIGSLSRGEAELVLKEKPVLKLEPEVNTLIRVDRSAKITYPDWVTRVVHPKLESVGPAEYDLTKIVLSTHYDRVKKDCTGYGLYQYLNQMDCIKDCLGYDDALAIQQSGLTALPKTFRNTVVICLRSVVFGQDNEYLAPCVYDDGDKIVVGWASLSHNFRQSLMAGLYPR